MSAIEAALICVLCVPLFHTANGEDYTFTAYPGVQGVTRGDVGQSAVLQWTLNMEPKRYHWVLFYFQGADVFGYETFTDTVLLPLSRNRSSLSYDTMFSIYQTSARGIGFRMEELRPEVAGNYTCILRGLEVTDDISHSAVMFVYDVPNTPDLNPSQTDNLIEGKSSVDMSCTSTSTSLPAAYRPVMLYTWNRNGVPIDWTNPPMNHEVAGQSGETLVISPVHHTDHHATYTCTTSEDGTQLSSPDADDVILEVLYGPYEITTDPAQPRAHAGKTVKITAMADCNPQCDFAWTNGTDIRSTTGQQLIFVMHENAATYMVTAENTYGKISRCITITVDTGSTYLVMVGVFAAVACLSIIGNITCLILFYRKGGFPCPKDARKAQTSAMYVNAEVLQNRQVSVVSPSTEVTSDYETVDTRTRDPPKPSVYAALP